MERAEPLHTAVGDVLATRALFRCLCAHADLATLGDAGMQRLQW